MVGGAAANQAYFYDRSNHVIVLTAPHQVLVRETLKTGGASRRFLEFSGITATCAVDGNSVPLALIG